MDAHHVPRALPWADISLPLWGALIQIVIYFRNFNFLRFSFRFSKDFLPLRNPVYIDALRAEPTNKAGAEPSDGAARAEPSSLELCRVATEFEELKLV